MDQAHGPVTQTTPAPTRVAIVESGPRMADAAPWALAIVAVALFLYLFSGVLMPFAAGIALGYLLDPVAEKLERLGLNRLGAALFILAVSIILIVLALVLIGPVLGHQLSGFVENLPRIVLRLQALVSDWSAKLLDTSWGSDLATRLGLGSGNPGDIQKALADYAGDAAKWLGGFAKSLISGGAALVGILSLIVVTPVVAFYILVDWNRMIASMKSLVPPRYLPEVSAVAGDMDAALAGFLRGQSLVCLFLGLWYGLGLTLIGLNYGFLIGITAGFLSFIPYVGSLTALVVSAVVALVQGWPDWTMLAKALAVVIAGQFLEGNVLSPKLVGESVGLHPVWLMFALLASGSLFGFTGLIVAVPVAAALGVLLRFFFARYRESPFYLGEDSEAANQP
ncbi:MAG: AI-2E family transporter [Methylobacteriaceae bacterium]|nr:AI-2E family transporter [Methylobacteriaceae bacterium]